MAQQFNQVLKDRLMAGNTWVTPWPGCLRSLARKYHRKTSWSVDFKPISLKRKFQPNTDISFCLPWRS